MLDFKQKIAYFYFKYFTDGLEGKDFTRLEKVVEDWFYKVIAPISNPEIQLKKFDEEITELNTGILDTDTPAVIDAIADVIISYKTLQLARGNKALVFNDLITDAFLVHMYPSKYVKFSEGIKDNEYYIARTKLFRANQHLAQNYKSFKYSDFVDVVLTVTARKYKKNNNNEVVRDEPCQARDLIKQKKALNYYKKNKEEKEYIFNMYLASPFFNKEQLDRVKRLEDALDDLGYVDIFSPRLESNVKFEEGNSKLCFSMNIDAIANADIVIAVTNDKDLGTLFEAGYAYALKKPILYLYETKEKELNFNLMLSQSGLAFNSIDDVIKQIQAMYKKALQISKAGKHVELMPISKNVYKSNVKLKEY